MGWVFSGLTLTALMISAVNDSPLEKNSITFYGNCHKTLPNSTHLSALNGPFLLCPIKANLRFVLRKSFSLYKMKAF